MTDDVKTPRRYDSARRQEQAAQTRQDVLAAAGKLFRERGYGATPMPMIASEAGVAVETIYRGFGSKAGLFKAVVEAAVAGGSERAGVPVEERPAIRAVIEERDPRRQVELYAATQPGIHRRSGPLLRALVGAGRDRSGARRLWDEIEGARLGRPGPLRGPARRARRPPSRPRGRGGGRPGLDALLAGGPRPARRRSRLDLRAVPGLADAGAHEGTPRKHRTVLGFPSGRWPKPSGRRSRWTGRSRS